MKKFIMFLIVTLTAITICSCKGGGLHSDEPQPSHSESSTTEERTSGEEREESESGKTPDEIDDESNWGEWRD